MAAVDAVVVAMSGLVVPAVAVGSAIDAAGFAAVVFVAAAAEDGCSGMCCSLCHAAIPAGREHFRAEAFAGLRPAIYVALAPEGVASCSVAGVGMIAGREAAMMLDALYYRAEAAVAVEAADDPSNAVAHVMLEGAVQPLGTIHTQKALGALMLDPAARLWRWQKILRSCSRSTYSLCNLDRIRT